MEITPLTPQAITILEKRYLKRDARGQVIETPEEMFWRVAQNIAEAERFYGNQAALEELSETFFLKMDS